MLLTERAVVLAWADKLPLCVVINGPSAVGTTLAGAIQDHADEPLLRFGVEELYRMVPDPWAGRRLNNNADEMDMLLP